MKRKVLLWSLAVSAIAIIFSSCRKDPLSNLTAEESRIYITHQDSAARFYFLFKKTLHLSVYTSYLIPDTGTSSAWDL